MQLIISWEKGWYISVYMTDNGQTQLVQVLMYYELFVKDVFDMLVVKS